MADAAFVFVAEYLDALQPMTGSSLLTDLQIGSQLWRQGKDLQNTMQTNSICKTIKSGGCT